MQYRPSPKGSCLWPWDTVNGVSNPTELDAPPHGVFNSYTAIHNGHNRLYTSIVPIAIENINGSKQQHLGLANNG